MKKQRRSRPPWPLVLALPLLISCDNGLEPPIVGSLTLGTVQTELTIGSTVQLVATAASETGSAISGHPVTWSSSNPAVVTVSPSGLVTALSAGTATVTAASAGKSASVTFHVRPGPCTAATAGAIALGQTRSGSLGANDCLLYDSFRAAGWSLELTTTTGIRIAVSSPTLQPELIVTNTQRDVVLWGHWHPDGGTQAIGELPAGQYIVWVMAYDHGPTVTYQLSASQVQFCGAASAGAVIGLGQTITGTLTGSDCLFIHGERAAGHRLNIAAATDVRIDLSSTQFDPLLVVTDHQLNVLWWNDDWGTSTDARIETRLPAGEYLVWVTSFWQPAGSYQLTVTEVEIELCAAVGTLSIGGSVTGALSASDCVIDGARYADPWTLTVAAPLVMQLDLTSNQFDTFLILTDQDGTVLVWDDDGGSGTNSRLVYHFQPGVYRVLVTSYYPWETGTYQLSAQAVGGAGSTAPMLEPSAAAAPFMKLRKHESSAPPR